MTVAFQLMIGILERWNNNQVTPSLSKPHELSYRSNKFTTFSKYLPHFLFALDYLTSHTTVCVYSLRTGYFCSRAIHHKVLSAYNVDCLKILRP